MPSLSLRVAACVVCVAALSTACQQTQAAAAGQTHYQVRVSALAEGLALAKSGRAFVRVCAPVDMTLSIVEAANGPANLKNVEDSRADIAFVASSLLYEGYRGVIPEFPERFEKISGLAVLQPLVEHVLVGPRSTISSLKDLAGRTVAIGRPGARNAITGPKLLAGAHLARPAHELQTDFDTATAKLFDGTVDAVLLPAPVPFPAVTQAVSRGARLIEIRGPLADSLRESVRFVRPYAIPPDTYPGVHSRIVTLGIDTVLVARRNLPNGVARGVVAALFDCLPRLSAADPSFQTVDITRAAATPVPLHPGAALFYRERELEP
ncbi:MAG TPA: TAXI family TRAP transporter solute-binding subunit [Vicinamibacterales bacterium]|nr:TAXI family TRAP transporter solute-binding subunit [Vicinamibacterales bacterium]